MSTLKRVFAAALLTFTLAVPAQAQDFWSSLGYAEVDARDRLWMSLTANGLYVPAVAGVRALPQAARNSFITKAASYAKAWTKSADFQQRYAEWRELMKPEKPEALMTTADRRAKDKADLQKVIKSLDSAMAQAKGMPEVQAGIKAAIDAQKAMIKEIDDPANPNYGKDVAEAMAADHANERAEYAKALKEWETKYPVSATPVIRATLREFLALSATVDFAARVRKTESGALIFVKQEYEEKPAAWKAIYRAGKETTDALRSAAQQWLTELR